MKFHFESARCQFKNDRNTTTDPSRVTCRQCRKSTTWLTAAADQHRAKLAAFAAATPAPVQNPWNNRPIACRECGHDLFRYWGRSLDTNNHKCAKCGYMNHTMTETGMSA